jgi:peptidoglycan/xylan/chitin deacetylase (PgdA/CDA1 family)
MSTGYFFRSPFVLPWLYPGLMWRMAADMKEIYLTFDDGPVPGPTEFALEALDKAKAKATFFCIGGNVRKHPEVFKCILEKGHSIGNHTFHHLNGWKTELSTYVEDVQLCADEISKYGAPASNLFRPPYGRITRSQIGALMNQRIIMWDVLTNDYAKNLSPERCLRGSISSARPGSIVVFHDSLKAERNMTFALPRFLEHFASLGYSFKSLP